MVLRTPNSELRAQARPEDLQLVIEVSDSTLVYDLTVKSGLYARAGIPEYWVLDLKSRRMMVHRTPQAGHYQSILVYSEFESVSPLAAPQAAVRITDVLFSQVS
jgi:Uma2 family endonuclease